jgi:hypothetical protein
MKLINGQDTKSPGLAIITRPMKSSYKAIVEMPDGTTQQTWQLTLEQAKQWCYKRGATQIIIGQ